MSESCPECGMAQTGKIDEGYRHFDCFSFAHESGACFQQSKQCTALAAATKRAESAEQENATRVKEYREKVEQLETDKAFYHDKWLNALERLKAAEQEDARMSKSLSMDALESDVAALLAQPKGGPDA